MSKGVYKPKSEPKKKVLLVAHCGWGIYNFRNDLIRKARDIGFEVVLVSPYDEYVPKLKSQGFRWVRWNMKRGSKNIFRELWSIYDLSKIYSSECADIIHQDTIKPSIYGSISAIINKYLAKCSNKSSVLSSLMGVGSLFSNKYYAKALRYLIYPILKTAFSFGSDRVTFSNKKDMKKFVNKNIIDEKKGKVMVSEFVNTNKFRPARGRNEDKTVVLMASRMLWDKGVGEFVQAAKMLQKESEDIQFWLAGEPDPENSGSVPETKLRQWEDTGAVRWLGHRSDMPDLLRQADIAALPTYYNEGLPRFLAEAAATGLPLIATDMEACRRVVESEWNGFVIPKKNPAALATAVKNLAGDDELRSTMGQNSLSMARKKISRRVNLPRWIDLYKEIGSFNKKEK